MMGKGGGSRAEVKGHEHTRSIRHPAVMMWVVEDPDTITRQADTKTREQMAGLASSALSWGCCTAAASPAWSQCIRTGDTGEGDGRPERRAWEDGGAEWGRQGLQVRGQQDGMWAAGTRLA